jgi:ribonuclease HI
MKYKAILSPYSRIGGTKIHMPLFYITVQTDGSFRQQSPKARVAVLMTDTFGKRIGDMAPVFASDSTETEWASVATGLRLAIDHGEEAIALENDNLGVIHGIMDPRNSLRHEYSRYYCNEIYRLANKTAWTGVRWIPREMNTADRLFHPPDIDDNIYSKFIPISL